MDSNFTKPSLDILYKLVNKPQKEKMRIILEENALSLYKKCSEETDFEYSSYEENIIKEKIKNQIQEIKEKYGDIKDDESISKREIEMLEVYTKYYDFENFEEGLEEIKKIDSVKIDGILCKLRFYFILNKTIKEKEDLFNELTNLEKLVDWERKNKFKSYYALFLLSTGSFKRSSLVFADILSVFTSTELIGFEKLVLYSAFAGIIYLPKRFFKKKIFLNSEVLEIKNKIPEVYNLMDSYCNNDYSSFYGNLIEFLKLTLDDPFLKKYSYFFSKCIKAKVYYQLFNAYVNIKITKIAELFRISESYIEKDIMDLIFSMNLDWKIDGIDKRIVIHKNDGNVSDKFKKLEGQI